MTQHYLLGELSIVLGELQTSATNEAAVRDAARLRREVETLPVTAFALLAARALELTDDCCWNSLTRGEAAAFDRQAAIFVELSEFAVCAGLVDDR